MWRGEISIFHHQVSKFYVLVSPRNLELTPRLNSPPELPTRMTNRSISATAVVLCRHVLPGVGLLLAELDVLLDRVGRHEGVARVLPAADAARLREGVGLGAQHDKVCSVEGRRPRGHRCKDSDEDRDCVWVLLTIWTIISIWRILYNSPLDIFALSARLTLRRLSSATSAAMLFLNTSRFYPPASSLKK